MDVRRFRKSFIPFGRRLIRIWIIYVYRTRTVGCSAGQILSPPPDRRIHFISLPSPHNKSVGSHEHFCPVSPSHHFYHSECTMSTILILVFGIVGLFFFLFTHGMWRVRRHMGKRAETPCIKRCLVALFSTRRQQPCYPVKFSSTENTLYAIGVKT